MNISLPPVRTRDTRPISRRPKSKAEAISENLKELNRAMSTTRREPATTRKPCKSVQDGSVVRLLWSSLSWPQKVVMTARRHARGVVVSVDNGQAMVSWDGEPASQIAVHHLTFTPEFDE